MTTITVGIGRDYATLYDASVFIASILPLSEDLLVEVYDSHVTAQTSLPNDGLYNVTLRGIGDPYPKVTINNGSFFPNGANIIIEQLEFETTSSSKNTLTFPSAFDGIVQKCIISGVGNGIYLESSTEKTRIVKNCLFINARYTVSGIGSHQIFSFLNNTIYTSWNNIFAAIGVPLQTGTFILKNNIITSTAITGPGQSVYFFNTGYASLFTLDFSNNIYWAYNSVDLIWAWNGSSQSTLAGHSANTGETNSSLIDPAMLDPENGDFDIGISSPAVDTGFNTSITDDILNRVRDANIDIGAYEYPQNLPEIGLFVGGVKINTSTRIGYFN